MTELGLQTNQKRIAICVFVLQKNNYLGNNFYVDIVFVLMILILFYFNFYYKMHFYNCFLSKYTIFCDFYNKQKSKHKTKNKQKFSKLKKSNTFKKLLKSFKFNNELKCLKTMYNHKLYLLNIAQLIDTKINNNNTHFRTHQKETLIENIAREVVETTLKNNHPILQKTYIQKHQLFNVKEKENKVSKLLIVKYLLENLIILKEKMDKLLKIIIKSKNAKSYSFCKNNIYSNAKLYGIAKYHKNSTKIFYQQNINKNSCLKDFFSYLDFQEVKVKIIVHYLIILFKS